MCNTSSDMGVYQYTSESKNRSRHLRKNQTAVEKLLWQKLRDRQLLNSKFYRQYPIGNYIVDFYCPHRRLVIELDGSQHLKQKEYDKRRTIFLEKCGISVLRFWDNEVESSLANVLEEIGRNIIRQTED